MTAVWLEIDGSPVKAEDCCWLTYAPCGCVSGVCLVDVGDEVLVTEEQALAYTHENKQLREESIRQGDRLELAARSTFAAIENFGRCPHIPQWGVEPTPIPEGMVWASPDGSGRRTNIKHLIDSDKVNDYSSQSKPLCGKATRGVYRDERWSTSSCAECVKCRETAMALSPALAVTS
jgi:hypothetical protein